MYQEKILSRIREFGIYLLSVFGYHTSRKREYDFALNAINNIPNSRLKILDVGSTGSLFPLKLAEKGHYVYIMDVREYPEKHPNLTVKIMDVKNTSFPDNFFDVVTCISTIEHIGMAAYHDPMYEKGDKLAMEEFKRILRDNGLLVLTTPFSGKFKYAPLGETEERIYDYQGLMNLFDGWRILREEYYIPKKSKHWINSTRHDAENEHPAYMRSNLSCFILQKINKM